MSFVISLTQLPKWTLPQEGKKRVLHEKGNPMFKSAAGADVARVSSLYDNKRDTAEHHTLDYICDIGTLIGRDFVFHTEIAPAKPMITEDLTEPVMAGGVVRVLERRKNEFLWTIWRIHSNFCCTAHTNLLYF